MPASVAVGVTCGTTGTAGTVLMPTAVQRIALQLMALCAVLQLPLAHSGKPNVLLFHADDLLSHYMGLPGAAATPGAWPESAQSWPAASSRAPHRQAAQRGHGATFLRLYKYAASMRAPPSTCASRCSRDATRAAAPTPAPRPAPSTASGHSRLAPLTANQTYSKILPLPSPRGSIWRRGAPSLHICRMSHSMLHDKISE